MTSVDHPPGYIICSDHAHQVVGSGMLSFAWNNAYANKLEDYVQMELLAAMGFRDSLVDLHQTACGAPRCFSIINSLALACIQQFDDDLLETIKPAVSIALKMEYLAYEEIRANEAAHQTGPSLQGIQGPDTDEVDAQYYPACLLCKGPCLLVQIFCSKLHSKRIVACCSQCVATLLSQPVQNKKSPKMNIRIHGAILPTIINNNVDSLYFFGLRE